MFGIFLQAAECSIWAGTARVFSVHKAKLYYTNLRPTQLVCIDWLAVWPVACVAPPLHANSLGATNIPFVPTIHVAFGNVSKLEHVTCNLRTHGNTLIGPRTLPRQQVVPLSAVGRGIPTSASPTVVAREGAAAAQTVAGGAALVQGMAGVVYEQQVQHMRGTPSAHRPAFAVLQACFL